MKEGSASIFKLAIPAIILGAADCSLLTCFWTSSLSSSSRDMASRRSSAVMLRVDSTKCVRLSSEASPATTSRMDHPLKASFIVFLEDACNILSLGGEPSGMYPKSAKSLGPASTLLSASKSFATIRHGTFSSTEPWMPLNTSSSGALGKEAPKDSFSPVTSMVTLTAWTPASSMVLMRSSSTLNFASVPPNGIMIILTFRRCRPKADEKPSWGRVSSSVSSGVGGQEPAQGRTLCLNQVAGGPNRKQKDGCERTSANERERGTD
mmetsp:Transcript_87321/g.182768  ORF Transcript_87321/g.182768 Transcript_87321/m.182768 type:complete len:265 (-) Transcript_87321:124-918(-)